ncbi:MAG: hypothetical protein O3A10_13625 [Chloroflexi bacterium]|nr:hypothetical protein [Chloroflexota bacterium]MDA1147947.1 hypothetical protein [Chloroflexota bacterium]
MAKRRLALTALLGASLLLGGCIFGDGDGSATATPEATPTAALIEWNADGPHLLVSWRDGV